MAPLVVGLQPTVEVMSLLLEMKSSLATIHSKIDSLTRRLGDMKEKLDKQLNLIYMPERRISDIEHDSAQCSRLLKNMARKMEKIKLKNEYL